VPRRQTFLAAEFSRRFEKSYAALTREQQGGVDRAILALMEQSPTPAMRVKPIEPEKYYREAWINTGDRLIHRIEGGRLFVVDVVSHDDIGRYGQRG
jgi:hypothetical protein